MPDAATILATRIAAALSEKFNDHQCERFTVHDTRNAASRDGWVEVKDFNIKIAAYSPRWHPDFETELKRLLEIYKQAEIAAESGVGECRMNLPTWALQIWSL